MVKSRPILGSSLGSKFQMPENFIPKLLIYFLRKSSLTRLKCILLPPQSCSLLHPLIFFFYFILFFFVYIFFVTYSVYFSFPWDVVSLFVVVIRRGSQSHRHCRIKPKKKYAIQYITFTVSQSLNPERIDTCMFKGYVCTVLLA